MGLKITFSKYHWKIWISKNERQENWRLAAACIECDGHKFTQNCYIWQHFNFNCWIWIVPLICFRGSVMAQYLVKKILWLAQDKMMKWAVVIRCKSCCYLRLKWKYLKVPLRKDWAWSWSVRGYKILMGLCLIHHPCLCGLCLHCTIAVCCPPTPSTNTTR